VFIALLLRLGQPSVVLLPGSNNAAPPLGFLLTVRRLRALESTAGFVQPALVPSFGTEHARQRGR